MLRSSSLLRGYYKIPGRKSLDEVVKLPLFEAATPQQVASIWNTHHMQFVQYWGRAISSQAYYALEPRLRKSPYFVIPCFRDKGLFNVVTNFKDDLIGVVPLGEWQKKQDASEVHMTIQFFTELARSKNLVLVRCEIKDQVFVRTDCIFLTQMVLKYYTIPRLYEEWVETFNKRPGRFDFHAYLRAMKDEAHKDNVEILDKKSEMRLDAYGPVIDTPPDSVARKILQTLDTGAPTPPPSPAP